jgi:hypothetical protein
MGSRARDFVNGVLGLALMAAPACGQTPPRGAEIRVDTSLVNGLAIEPYERRFEVYKTRDSTPSDTSTPPEWSVGTLDDRVYLTAQGGDTMLVRVRHLHVIGAETFDTSTYDRRTLILRTDRWHFDRTSSGYTLRGSCVSYFYEFPDGRRDVADTALPAPAFSRESADLLLQAIGYDPHQTLQVPVFYYSPMAEQFELVTLTVRTTGRERVHLPKDKERDAWVVGLSNGDTYWLDPRDRRLLMRRTGIEESEDVIVFRYVAP